MDSTSPMSANYDANSHYQMESNLKNLDDLVEALKVFKADKTITMADIGCATGLTSMQLFHKAFLRLKEDTESQVLVHHVDVPTNEWGVLFRNYWSGQETYRSAGNAFISAVGGTMYTRLFPDNYLNVVYSAFTLHWLSKKIMSPPNATEEDIRQLAAVQAKLDIELFLSLRLQELKPMGRMVLRTASTIAFTAPIVICINQMKADGHLPPTLSLCSYNVVSYHSLEEHLEVILKFQGKLKIVTAKADRVLHPLWGPGTENESAETLAERRMMGLRAASETSFQYFLKEYNLDVIGLSSMLFRYVRDYYFNHPEPVYLDEVYFVLEKLPTS